MARKNTKPSSIFGPPKHYSSAALYDPATLKHRDWEAICLKIVWGILGFMVLAFGLAFVVTMDTTVRNHKAATQRLNVVARYRDGRAATATTPTGFDLAATSSKPTAEAGMAEVVVPVVTTMMITIYVPTMSTTPLITETLSMTTDLAAVSVPTIASVDSRPVITETQLETAYTPFNSTTNGTQDGLQGAAPKSSELGNDEQVKQTTMKTMYTAAVPKETSLR